MALSLDQAAFQREKKGSKKGSKKTNRLSGLLERIPKRIRERSVKRSLSRSKSAAMANEKKSVTSLLSISSYDHPSQQSFDHFSASQQASSEDGGELPTSYVVPIIPVLPSTSNKMTDEEKSRNRKTNLSRLKDKGILDELEAFEKLCNEFNDKCSHKKSTDGNGSADRILQAVDNGQHGQRITMTENLI